MSKFITELHLKEHPTREYYWILMDELIYESGTERYVVPTGFPTNIASVPRVLWGFIPPYGKYSKAAILHDFFYSSRGSVTREYADHKFYELLKECGVGPIKSQLMYRFVRMFGKTSWRRKT